MYCSEQNLGTKSLESVPYCFRSLSLHDTTTYLALVLIFNAYVGSASLQRFDKAISLTIVQALQI